MIVLPGDSPGRDEEEFRAQFDPKHTVVPVDKEFSRQLPAGVTRFIITGAQNATPVDSEFWAALNTAAGALGAELLVVPFRYKNATSLWSMSQRNAEYWAEEVQPYLWSKRLQLNEHLTLVADMKMQPTNGNPLGGLEAMSGLHSAIFAHPKLQMKTVATPSARMGKILTTTGVCTKENYTSTRLGKISQFHHSFSAIYVELDGKRFYLTQLHFDRRSGSITHLDQRFCSDGVIMTAPPALALDAGDMHIRFIDPSVQAARAELIQQVRPKHWIFNDTLDSYSCTPHHGRHPFIERMKNAAGYGDVREEVGMALDYLVTAAKKDRKIVVVPSNHDDMLYRWLEAVDAQGTRSLSKDNAEFYHELALQVSKGSILDPTRGAVIPDPFTLLVRNIIRKKNIIALDRDQSFALAGVELAMHGDIGINGARGSRKSLARIGVKSVIGHSHCPGIEEGCYQTGTSTFLRLEYNHGASGWLNADVLLNADGKRQVIIYIDGRYRAPRS